MSVLAYCAENRGHERKTETYMYQIFPPQFGYSCTNENYFFSKMLQVASIANNKETLRATYIDCDVSRLRFVACSKCKITISRFSNRTS